MLPKIRRILYATDLSENARYAYGYAADLAAKYDAKVTILFVIEQISHMTDIYVNDILGSEKWKELKEGHKEEYYEKIRNRVENFCNEAGSDIKECTLMVDDIKIKEGVPFQEIIGLCDEINADAVVMGSYGHSALTELFVGGTTRRVVNKSRIPVLVVRLPEN